MGFFNLITFIVWLSTVTTASATMEHSGLYSVGTHLHYWLPINSGILLGGWAKQDAEEALLSQFSSTFTQPSLHCIRLADSEGHSGSVNEQESKFLKSLEVIKTLSGSELLLAIIEAQINAVESTPTIVQVRSATQCEISLFAVPTWKVLNNRMLKIWVLRNPWNYCMMKRSKV